MKAKKGRWDLLTKIQVASFWFSTKNLWVIYCMCLMYFFSLMDERLTMIDCYFISYHKPGSKGKHFYDVFMQKYMYVCQFIRWLFVTLKGKLWWLGQWWRRAGSLLPQETQQVWQFVWWSHKYYGLCTWCYAGSE